MNMSPISQEYERELRLLSSFLPSFFLSILFLIFSYYRRPIQNILSGRLARLILIQLQFVKKELLMAMQGLFHIILFTFLMFIMIEFSYFFKKLLSPRCFSFLYFSFLFFLILSFLILFFPFASFFPSFFLMSHFLPSFYLILSYPFSFRSRSALLSQSSQSSAHGRHARRDDDPHLPISLSIRFQRHHIFLERKISRLLRRSVQVLYTSFFHSFLLCFFLSFLLSFLHSLFLPFFLFFLTFFHYFFFLKHYYVLT